MSNTKYKKVATRERLPEEADFYTTDVGELQFNKHDKSFWLDGTYEMHPDWWLEEVPDYEDEMREMLDKAVQYLSECDWHPSYVETYSNFVMNANEFLTKLKTES